MFNKILKILEEIKSENKKISEHIHKPPVLCAKFHDWIGYGSEPTIRKKDNKRYSFNALREKIIVKTFKSYTDKIINDNKGTIQRKNKTYTIKEALISITCYEMIKQIKRLYDDKNIKRDYKYSKEEVLDNELYKNIRNIVENYVYNPNEVKDNKIVDKNGMIFYINEYKIENAKKILLYFYCQSNPKAKYELKKILTKVTWRKI